MIKTFTVTIEADDDDSDQINYLKDEVDAKQVRDSIEGNQDISLDVCVDEVKTP